MRASVCARIWTFKMTFKISKEIFKLYVYLFTFPLRLWFVIFVFTSVFSVIHLQHSLEVTTIAYLYYSGKILHIILIEKHYML